jgi:hypothetical protein
MSAMEGVPPHSYRVSTVYVREDRDLTLSAGERVVSVLASSQVASGEWRLTVLVETPSA